MNFNYKYWIIVVFWVGCFILPENSMAQTISLEQVLSKIEQNNPSLLSYENKISAANESAKGAGAWMPPKAGVEYDDVPYDFDYKGTQLRFSISQDIPNGRKIKAKRTYRSSLASIEKYEGESRRVELFTLAKEAYHKRYIAEKRIKVLEENIKIMKLMIALGEKQLAISRGELASIYRLKARLVENESMLVHEQNVVRSETSSLNYLMDADVNSSFEIDTNGLIRNYRSLGSVLAIDSLDFKRNDILKMNSEINAMRLNQNMASLRSKPEYGIRFEHFSRLGGRPDAYSVMGTMTIPIAPWSAKEYKSEVKAMDYSIRAMEQEKQNSLNRAKQMIKMYLIELESEYKELDNYTKLIIPAYKKSLDANLLAYGQNTSDLNMTLMSWDDLQMAQMQYLDHLDTYLFIQANYEKEMQIR